MRVIYPSFDPDVSSNTEAAIQLPPTHSLGLVGSLLNFCFIMRKTAQLPKAMTSLNVSLHLLQEMMPFQVLVDFLTSFLDFRCLTLCDSPKKQFSWCLWPLASKFHCERWNWPQPVFDTSKRLLTGQGKKLEHDELSFQNLCDTLVNKLCAQTKTCKDLGHILFVEVHQIG